MAYDPGFQALEARRGFLGQVAENSSRHAFCQVTWKTHGWGEFKMPTAAYFTCTFIEPPHIASGVSLDGDTLVPGRFPRVTCGVYKWIQDENGLYTGAWVFFVVDTQSIYIPTAAVEPNYDLIHYVEFSGLAAKVLPAHLLDDTL